MLIESDPHQTRIAVLEDDRLTEIFVERHRHRGLVGNVYKGRVTRVLPGMQAAFVDIGLERDAFLYVSDVAARRRGDGRAGDRRAARRRARRPHHAAAPPSIDDLLKPGQEIIVQVVKDPLPNKGARISTHVTLPGRYLVLLPTVRHFGVSRRIEDETERERLLAVLDQLPVRGGGLIVRTVGEGKGPEEFESDLAYLSRLWEKIRQRAGKVSAPTLLHQDLDLALRVVRDLLRPDFSRALGGRRGDLRADRRVPRPGAAGAGRQGASCSARGRRSSSSSASRSRSRRRSRARCGSSRAATS